MVRSRDELAQAATEIRTAAEGRALLAEVTEYIREHPDDPAVRAGTEYIQRMIDAFDAAENAKFTEAARFLRGLR